MTSVQTVHMAEAISPNLMLRGVADAFFDRLERMDVDCLVLDFSGIRSISRSFAHQYILRKKANSKTVREENVPENVSKMLALVERSVSVERPRSVLASLNCASAVTI